ncbi:MAG: ChaN family lipoprotein [Dissulfurimicrobium sp.]|uniref:ChaN family lipoprotein n=1 Tax=Dissulfurimicrobium sp. TaxID=2022436 RepID=UPI00404941CF
MKHYMVLFFIFFAFILLCLEETGAVFSEAFAEAEDSQIMADDSRSMSMDIAVRFDPISRKISGRATARLMPLTEAMFCREGFDLKWITINGKVITPDFDGLFFKIRAPREGAEIVISFERDVASNSAVHAGLADTSDFVALLDNWCPTFKGLAHYRLSAAIPEGLVAVSEADSVQRDKKAGKKYVIYTFDFSHPRNSISLVIGPYHVSRLDYGSIELYAYFFPEDIQLAKTYLEKARDYIKFYEGLIGSYPFKRFAVVENRAPTGLGFATYTLLGQQVIRLPFIADTSFGHEILHSWFGNSIYVNYEQGNWCEGLTTYLADYLYKEKKGEGKTARHDMLIDYQSYVHKDNTLTLSGFTSQVDKSTKAIGYYKCAFVFHMLKNEIGDEAFYKAIRRLVSDYRFKVASWKDIAYVFSQASGRDLSYFFNEWLNRADAPVLSIARDPSGVGIVIEQHTEAPYVLTIPVLIETVSGPKTLWQKIDSKKNIIDFRRYNEVLNITLDPDYNVFRRLSPEELPPVLSRLLGDEKRYFVMPQDEAEQRIYAAFARFLRHLGFSELEASAVAGHDKLQKGSFIILGDLAAMKYGLKPLPDIKNGVLVDVRPNPSSPDEVAVVIKASSEMELAAIETKLFHYGKYSFLRFENGVVVDKRQKDVKGGISLEIIPEVSGIASKDISSLDEILDKIVSRQVIFFGERHDDFGHHLAELKVIEGLYNRGCRFAVGMEMFQRPFQVFLDQYLKGEIDERQFLAKTEYYKRWGHDYHLYRPIIEFCKAHGIPIVALNLNTEISEKVARGGLSSLTTDEKKIIPKNLDFSNFAYRDWLKDIFSTHPDGVTEDFNNFFEAQVLWDETMAMAIHEYLAGNPERRMVVLAGAGHLIYGYGIPSRVARRGNDDQVIIIAADHKDIDIKKGMADYFLFPPDVPAPFSARLGISLDDKDSRLTIKDVMPGSVAQACGLRSGDVILAIDGRPLKTIEDLKLELFFKDKDSKVQLHIIRKRKLLKDEIIDVIAGPFEPMEMYFHNPHTRIDDAKKGIKIKGK